jgi:PP-loop superfamily ATP-utilizing enzyme
LLELIRYAALLFVVFAIAFAGGLDAAFLAALASYFSANSGLICAEIAATSTL